MVNLPLIAHFSTLPDFHQSLEYARTMHDIGWETVGKPGSQLFLRRLGPFALAKIQRYTSLDQSWLSSIKKKYHTLTTYLEPGIDITSPPPGFAVEPFAHSCTSLIDLRMSPAELLNSFKQKTRYNIHLAERKKIVRIVTYPLSDITPKIMAEFMHERKIWSERKGLVGYDEQLMRAVISRFKDNGWLHFAYIGDQIESTLLVLRYGQIAIYYAAFSSLLGYKHFGPTLLTWNSLQTAQSAGCTVYDFGGIYDPRYPKMYKKWVGFTKFKAGFNPTTIKYPKTTLQLGW